jgi:hypothetical protein
MFMPSSGQGSRFFFRILHNLPHDLTLLSDSLGTKRGSHFLRRNHHAKFSIGGVKHARICLGTFVKGYAVGVPGKDICRIFVKEPTGF